jgi:hypothetical protein
MSLDESSKDTGMQHTAFCFTQLHVFYSDAPHFRAALVKRLCQCGASSILEGKA